MEIIDLLEIEEPIILEGKRPTDDEIPKNLLEECKILSDIFYEYSGKNLKTCMFYDLWNIYSDLLGVGYWRPVKELLINEENKKLIFDNLLNIIKNIEFHK